MIFLRGKIKSTYISKFSLFRVPAGWGKFICNGKKENMHFIKSEELLDVTNSIQTKQRISGCD